MSNQTGNASDVEATTDFNVQAAEAKMSQSAHEFEQAQRPARAVIDPPHVATKFFAQRFRELAASVNVRMLDTHRVRKLTPLTIQKLLKEQAPDLPVSQTQIYRYFHGETPPRIDVVYELARLFGKSPSYFMPDDLLD